MILITPFLRSLTNAMIADIAEQLLIQYILYIRKVCERIKIMYFGNRSNDYGPNPFVIDIEKATLQNNYFRKALWTGNNLQLTLMSINPGEEIGLEVHPDLDQFIRIEQGQGVVMMGDCENCLCFQNRVYGDFAIIIPAGKWHNLINTGRVPLKLYSIYAPPQHPFGTVHVTKQDEEHH